MPDRQRPNLNTNEAAAALVERFTPPRILTAVRGEARYGLELARLVANPGLRRPTRDPDAPPVLLIPGLLAGDSSLVVLRSWLRRRGHAVAMSQIRVNVDCAERTTARLQAQLRALAAASGGPVFLIGQSRGGALARCLATREPESVCGLVMLGSPVVAPLAVSAPVLFALRSVARLGDAGLPGVLSSECADGPCCADFRRDLAAPLRPDLRAVAVHSRSDGVVDWRACLDPHAAQIEVGSSHSGMAVNSEVYRVLERVLATPKENRWTG